MQDLIQKILRNHLIGSLGIQEHYFHYRAIGSSKILSKDRKIKLEGKSLYSEITGF